MYKLTFMDGAMPRAYQLKEGETVIGRAPTCDLVITAPLMSRHHAVVRVDRKQVFLRDARSTYGTTLKGSKVTAEHEIDLHLGGGSTDLFAPKSNHRRCTLYGLIDPQFLPDALRLTVGTEEANRAAVAALKDFMAQ